MGEYKDVTDEREEEKRIEEGGERGREGKRGETLTLSFAFSNPSFPFPSFGVAVFSTQAHLRVCMLM